MIDLFDLWNDFKALVNTFQGGNYPPASVFTPAVNDISIELWNRWTREAEKSQEARDNLFWALKSKNLIVENSNTYYGIATPPPDYGRFAAAKILIADDTTIPSKEVDNGKVLKKKELVDYKTDEELTEDYYNTLSENNVENIDTQRWSACLKHLTKMPTFENPKLTQIDTYFKVAPRTVSVLVLDYYIAPTPAVFAYTVATPNVQTGDGDFIIYDKNNSVPLQWSPTVKNEFLMALGEKFGLYTRDQFLTQAMMAKNK